jgi:hypothetical protein
MMSVRSAGHFWRILFIALSPSSLNLPLHSLSTDEDDNLTYDLPSHESDVSEVDSGDDSNVSMTGDGVQSVSLPASPRNVL